MLPHRAAHSSRRRRFSQFLLLFASIFVLSAQVAMDHEVFLSLVDYLEALLAHCFMAPTVIGWAPLLATDLVTASILNTYIYRYR